MKKLLSFLLIFLSTFFFSQEYTFDYSVKINHKSLTTNDNEIDNFLFYYNNSNQNSLYNYNNGDLSLFDFDNKKKYVLKELKDKTIQFSKMYDLSNQKDEMQINIISVDKISDNNFLIKTYKNRNSETPNLILKINIEENENITPKLYLLDLSRNIHHKILLELQKTVGKNNFLIKSFEIDYRNGYKSFQEVTDLYIKRTVFKL